MSGGFIKGNQLSFSGKYADLTGKPSSANNYRISEEHMTIGTGNQTINVANTDRIIGLTFRIKETTPNSYHIMTTVIFGSNRYNHTVYIKRYPWSYSNFAQFDFKLTTTKIVIYNYKTGWRNDAGSAYLQANVIQLEKMIIFRKEIN